MSIPVAADILQQNASMFTRFDTMADLRASTVYSSGATTAWLNGYWTPGDGGGGEFVWNSTSTLADDGGTVIKPTGVGGGAGRWIRPFTSPINVKWFGAMPGDVNIVATANVTATNPVISVNTTSGFLVGQNVAIAGAGTNGAWFQSTIISIGSGTITIANAPITSVSGLPILVDDHPAFKAAMDCFGSTYGFNTGYGGRIIVPATAVGGGGYFFGNTLLIDRCVEIEGDTTGSAQFGSSIYVARGMTGIQCASRDDLGGGSVNGIIIKNLSLNPGGFIQGAWQANVIYNAGLTVIPTAPNVNGRVFIATVTGRTDPTTEPTWPTTVGATVNDGAQVWQCISPNGINMYVAARVENCSATNFAIGLNIFGGISGHGQGGDGPLSQTSLWYVANCFWGSNENCGMYVNGTDANAGICIRTTAYSNKIWGFNDDSDLGNTYIACHTDSNGNAVGSGLGGPYRLASNNGPGILVGCYSELGQNEGVLLTGSGGNTAFSGLLSAANPSGAGTFFADQCSPRIRTINKQVTADPYVNPNGDPLAIAISGNDNGSYTPLYWNIGLEVFRLVRDAPAIGLPIPPNLWTLYHQNTTAPLLSFTGDRYVDSERVIFHRGYQHGDNIDNPIFVFSNPTLLANGSRRNRGDRFEDNPNNTGFMGKVCIDPGMSYPSWQPNHSYSIGDIVNGQQPGQPLWYFRCTTGGTSGGSQPSWAINSSSINDNGVVWEAGQFGFTAWQANHIYAVGDLVIATPDFTNLFWECIFPGTSGGSQPAFAGVYFGNPTLADGTVIWQLKGWDGQAAKMVPFGQTSNWAQYTSNYNIKVTDRFLGFDSTGGAITAVTLPPPATVGPGWQLQVTDEGGAAGTNHITILPNASEKINGLSSLDISSNYGSYILYTNGTDWFAK